ncbi:MAG: M20/M25/M40 family metallo-hydrolase [Candidatus Micrarchaeota archaeon]|nr:M20/M25/M40 family metallo-hydrolase [Candidatus Micrarchaeota archaeon]
MGAILQARTIDVGQVRRSVERLGVKPVTQFLFPVIADSPVSKNKTPDDQMSTAKIVRDTMKALGVPNARIINHPGCHPTVYGEIKSDLPNAPTILVGGHYDGQPSSAKQWHVTKPHKPKLVTRGGEIRVFGRGTSDDWGQVLTHFMAVKMMRDLGIPVPVNIKFLIEGGEEIGSPKMDNFIRANKQLLKCDLVILTDSQPGRMSSPVVTTMARGLVGANVELKLGTNDPHSGTNLTVNALLALNKILDMKDLRTGKVNIPGFYDSVRILSDSERLAFNAMPFDMALFRRNNGLRVIQTLAGHSAQETIWTQPSYECHTVLSRTDEGLVVANLIPTHVKAYVTMRLVANQDPKAVFKLFKAEAYRRLAEFTNLSKSALSIVAESLAHPFAQDTSSATFKAVADGMAVGFDVSKVDFMGCGGTEPIAMYYQVLLGVPVVFNAFNSPADNYHGNDESLSITHGFQPGVVANVLIYRNLYDLRNSGSA